MLIDDQNPPARVLFCLWSRGHEHRTSWSPKPRYRSGPLVEHLAVMVKLNVPGKLFEWLVRKFYHLV